MQRQSFVLTAALRTLSIAKIEGADNIVGKSMGRSIGISVIGASGFAEPLVLRQRSAIGDADECRDDALKFFLTAVAGNSQRGFRLRT